MLEWTQEGCRRGEEEAMSVPAMVRLTPAEYLARERQAETKSEFFNSEIFAMAGASRAHNLIVANIARDLGVQLEDRPCELYPADMRVKVSETGLYTYPDVVVVCGEPQFEDDHVDTLLNPTLIVEILSPSTEAYDRGGKFAHYRELPSLREYVLISQDRCRVERFLRQPDEEWVLAVADEMSAALPLASIGCDLQLSRVYAKVALPPVDELPLRQRDEAERR
jgi:Uma2 family endonuclease